MTCLRHCGWMQANYLMLKSLWKNTISFMGWIDGFDLLWNCVLLHRWVCVYTGLPICGIGEWIWWGSTPQHLEKMGSSIEGNLGSTYICWWRALWQLELFIIWELKSIFNNPSVHGEHEVGYLPLFERCCPWAFVLQLRFSILVWGSYKGLPLTMACYVPVVQTTHAHM